MEEVKVVDKRKTLKIDTEVYEALAAYQGTNHIRSVGAAIQELVLFNRDHAPAKSRESDYRSGWYIDKSSGEEFFHLDQAEAKKYGLNQEVLDAVFSMLSLDESTMGELPRETQNDIVRELGFVSILETAESKEDADKGYDFAQYVFVEATQTSMDFMDKKMGRVK